MLDYNTDFKTPGQIGEPVQRRRVPHLRPRPGRRRAGAPSVAASRGRTRSPLEAGTTLTVGGAEGVLAQRHRWTACDCRAHQPGARHADAERRRLVQLHAGRRASSAPTASTYTVSNATPLQRSAVSTALPPLATLGGVNITAGAYRIGVRSACPASTDEFYGLTDRGPNVDGPNGTKVEPIPTFTPAIGKFRFVDGQASCSSRSSRCARPTARRTPAASTRRPTPARRSPT